MAGDGLGPMLIKASVGSAGLRMMSMLLSLVVGILLARNLGPSGYGVYALVMSITALLTVPTEFGLPSLVTREVAVARVKRDWGRMRGVLRWSNTIVAIMSLFLLAVSVGWLLLRQSDGDGLFSQTMIWGVMLIPLVALNNLRGATLRALGQIVRGQIPELLLRPGLFALLLLVTAGIIDTSLNAANAMAIHVVATAIAFTVGMVMLLYAIPDECRQATSIIESKAWIASAFPMALTEGMRFFQGHFAILLLGWLALQADVGIFRVAVQVGVLVALPVSILNIVIAPIVSKSYAGNDYYQLEKLVAYTAGAMFLGAFCILLVFVCFGQGLLGYFFGVEFEASYLALVIIGSSQLMSAFFGPNATLLNMTLHERLVTRAFSLSLILSIGSGLLLVWMYGVVGAAISSSIGLFTWNILMWRDAKRVLNIDTSVMNLRAVL